MVRHDTVPCDGDSKVFLKDTSLELYDKGIKKENCINHVAKRMYSSLDALRKAKKGLACKRKLTNVKMCTLNDNVLHVAMQQGVSASLLNSYSTDAEPRHIVRPTGTDSWCHYNQSKALEAAGELSGSRLRKPAFTRN